MFVDNPTEFPCKIPTAAWAEKLSFDNCARRHVTNIDTFIWAVIKSLTVDAICGCPVENFLYAWSQ